MTRRILALGVVLILALATRAAGQAERASFGMSMGGGEAAMAMAIGREAVDRYADLLGFDAAQRDAAMLLHEAYLEDYKLAADAIAQGMVDLTDESELTRDRDQFRSNMGRLMRGMLERRMELEERLLGDLETLAALPEDDDSFARVERARRRELAQSIAKVNGAWVDLFDVAGHTGVDGNPEVATLLRDYENQIDAIHRPLIDTMLRRTRRGIDMMEAAYAQARERASDEAFRAEDEAITKKLADADARAKATNDRFAQLIAQALPEGAAARWTDEYNRNAWPVVYRVSDASRVLGVAAGFEDLTGDQREQLDTLRTGYERDAAAINKRWAQAIDAHQAGPGNPWTGGGDSPDADRVKEDQERLDERLIERVRRLLTPEQAERLPSDEVVDVDGVLREIGG